MKLLYRHITVAVTLGLLLSLSALTVAAEPLTITTATLTIGGVDTPYTDSFAALGGTSPYSWKASGILPPGLSVSSAGVISGTPTSGGTYTFMAKVTDATPLTVTKQVFLTITSAQLIMPTVKPAKYSDCTNCHTTGTPNTAPPVTTITGKPLAESGTSAATFSFAADKAVSRFDCGLDGAALAPCASPVSYTALSDGSHTFRVRAIDTVGTVETPPIGYTWNITDMTYPHVSTPSLPDGTVAVPYNQTLTAYGGAGSNSWYIISGSLPNGLVLDYFSGTISGTPTLAGTYNFTVYVEDWLYAGSSKALTIVVAPSQNVKLIAAGQPDSYYATLSAALAGIPAGWSCQLATRQMDFSETVNMNRCGETLTFKSAFDPTFTTVVGPTIIQGSLIVTCGAVIADDLSIK
jgi:large repetitive protein